MALPLLNVRFILLISASFIAIFSSIAIYFCLPILISHVIRTQISLSSSSGSFNDWRLNSVIDRMYLYNITNLKELLDDSNDARPLPKLEQVGPITFRQEREKLNIQFNHVEETVTYDQKKRWFFEPHLSQFKTLEELNSTTIYHINVPMAGTTLNPEYAEFVEPVIVEQDMKLFMNHSAATLLFDGYFDILMEQAKAQGELDVDRFGWMHNLNDSITRNVRIFTGISNATLDKFGAIDRYQNTTKFSVWHTDQTVRSNMTNECNDFKLSSPGEFFPPPEYSIISYSRTFNRYSKDALGSNGPAHQLKKLSSNHEPANTDNSNNNQVFSRSISTAMDRHLSMLEKSESIDYNKDGRLEKLDMKVGKTITLFMPDLCRTIKLFYNGSYNFRDLLVDRYIANEHTFDYTSEGPDNNGQHNQCFCIYNTATRFTSCPPNGMMDLFSCRKGSPITISFPHFLFSTRDKSLEPYLRLFEDNVEPDLGEHQFFVDLESTLNLPVNVQITLQFNVHLKLEPSLNFTKEFEFLFKGTQLSNPPLKDLYLPQMWIKSSAQVDDNNLRNLKFIQKHLGLVTPLTALLFFGVASILLSASAKLAYDLTYGPKSGKPQSEQNSNAVESYSDEKKKYFSMSLLDDVGTSKSSGSRGARVTSATDGNNYHTNLNAPSTSRKTDCEMKATADWAESQPLSDKYD